LKEECDDGVREGEEATDWLSFRVLSLNASGPQERESMGI